MFLDIRNKPVILNNSVGFSGIFQKIWFKGLGFKRMSANK